MQHIVFTGERNSCLGLKTLIICPRAHYLSQSSFIFYSESQAGCNVGLVFGHKEGGSVFPWFESGTVLETQQDFHDVPNPVLKEGRAPNTQAGAVGPLLRKRTGIHVFVRLAHVD